MEVEIGEDRARAGLRHLQSTIAATMTARVLYVPQSAFHKDLCMHS